MSIYRVIKDKGNPYIMLNKHCIYNANISLKAKGLMAYFLSRPDHWEFYQAEILQNCKDGKDSLLSAIKELEKNGYIKRNFKRDKKGKLLGGYDYEIYEVPQNAPNDNLSENGKPESGKSENGENRKRQKPISENPPLINNDLKVINDLEVNNDIKVNKERENKDTHSQSLELIKYIEELTSSIGTISLSSIKLAVEKHGYEYTKLAVEKAISLDKCKMSYVNGILQNWAKEGYPSLEDINKPKKINKPSYSNKKPSSFCDYEQRSYDLESIENKLLGWE
ncbi:replication initiation and membrane attachment (plasmid) [Clostridiaceae bacterium 14S0207]|nr:replication initiation and membrane attachment [Clostridiaceae bacterium 14S0207]